MSWERSSVTVAVLFAVTSIGGPVACGGGGGGGSGEFDSSVSDDKKISALSQDQVKTICQDANDWRNKQTSTGELCLFNAHLEVAVAGEAPASDEKAQQQCKQSKQQCEEEPPSTGPNCENISGASSCDATVGLMEECDTAQHEAFEDMVSELPACNSVTASWYKDESGDVLFTAETPDPCAEFREKCPDLYESYNG